MKITQSHLTWYRYKKFNRIPSWANHLKNDIPPSIQFLINSQTTNTVDPGHVLNNLLGILRMARKRGAMLERLTEMSARPQCVSNPTRRAAFCKKWLKRINKSLTQK